MLSKSTVTAFTLIRLTIQKHQALQLTGFLSLIKIRSLTKRNLTLKKYTNALSKFKIKTRSEQQARLSERHKSR